MKVVTVDFDGTLYQGNSFSAMFRVGKKQFTLKEWFIVFTGLLKSILVRFTKGKEAFRHTFFKTFAKTFKGMSQEELHTFFKELVEIGREEIHHDLVNQIRQHQENGDIVIIVSGALHPFLQAFTHAIDLDVPIISTKLKFDEQNQCTGKIGTIINGEEKVNQVQVYVKNLKEKKDSIELWAYADSESDIPLFNFVDNPIVVNPSENMKGLAKEKEWSIFASS